jgi:hypothetical protein
MMTTDLTGIDLPGSFVLGWKVTETKVVFRMDFAAWPASRFYRKPKQDEWTCFRRGVLVFDRVTFVEGLRMQEDMRFSTDATGEKDYGNIDYFEGKDAEVRLSGDFGEVLVRCEAWHLEFKDENPANKVPEPTNGSVTPRANESTSK